MDTHVKVALIGLSKRSVEALLGVFRQRCQGRFVLSTPATAQVAVFNMDCKNGKQVWRTFHHRHPDLRVVVIGREPPTLDGVEYVAVPLSISTLEAAIDRAAAARKTAGRDKKPAATRSQKAVRTGPRLMAAARIPRCTGGVRMLPAVEHEVYFRPGDHLFGYFRQTATTLRNKAFRIELDDAAIAVDAAHRRVFINFSPQRLTEFAAAEQGATTTLEDFNPAAPIPDATCLHEYSLEGFLWYLAMVTARGRVPEGTPLDAPVYLRRWPNFTRLEECADAMRIAAVWVQQPRSLLNLYETLQVPVGHVLTFYTAAQAVGLAGIARREADTLIQPAVVKPSPYGNLINAVLNRFLRNPA